MKSIMISIQPQYVEKILNGGKTIEIRKTKPKCELPCKVYIYCTKSKTKYLRKLEAYNKTTFITENKDVIGQTDKVKSILGEHSTFIESSGFNGRVVAEFTLNKVDTLERDLNDWLPKNRYDVSNELLKDINLNQNELWNYGQGKTLYAWHIDDLKVYDKPKELSEFYIETIDDDCCVGCPYHETPIGEEPCKNCYENRKYITIPPQSWCYVKELENE